jgi:hypothetical protein
MDLSDVLLLVLVMAFVFLVVSSRLGARGVRERLRVQREALEESENKFHDALIKATEANTKAIQEVGAAIRELIDRLGQNTKPPTQNSS